MKKTYILMSVCAVIAIAAASNKVLFHSTERSVQISASLPSAQPLNATNTPEQVLTTKASSSNTIAIAAAKTSEIEHNAPATVAATPETSPTPAVALPSFNKDSLAKFDGQNADLPIYLAFDGLVYDVTEGKKYYEPGGSYHFLAGKDSTLLLKTFGGDLIKKKYPAIGIYVE